MKKHAKNTNIRGPKPNLFGFHAVYEAWLNPDRRISALYLTQQSVKGFMPAIEQAVKLGIKRPHPFEADKKQMDKMLPPGAVHQGIALAAEDLPDIYLQDLVIKSHKEPRSLFLMLDQVTDPHNVGAILRSACAFGVGGVIMQRKHAPDLTGVLAKTACGAVEHVPVVYETNLSRAIETLKEEGYFVYGLDERGEDNMAALGGDGKKVLVLGAEGPGLRRLVAEHCDSLLRLPTQGPIASLNVSNAAAVALYASVRV